MDSLPGGTYRAYGHHHALHSFANDYSHIADPNLRRRLALSEIDKVPFGLYHIRATLVAGVGFFLDSYDIFAINLITIFLGLAFWSGPPEDARYGFGGNNGALPVPVSQALKASTSAGIIIGQIVFGWLADALGRRKMYGVELIIILISTLLCALVSPSQSMNSTALLTFWRVMMGIGIGGDYPLSSVITSEFAPTRWRGAMMAGVFSMQGFGQLLAAVVALVVTVAFKSSFAGISDVSECDYSCQTAADQCWRIIVAVGAVPACFALYYRLTIPETPRYTFDIAHDVEMADANIQAFMSSRAKGEVDIVRQARLKKVAGPSLTTPRASWRDLTAYFGRWKNLKVLIGTALSWFCLDLAFYGLGLNNSLVLSAIGFSGNASLYSNLYDTAMGTIILSVAGSLPGYWVAIFTIDTVGRKFLQIFGFLILTVIFCILGFAYHRLSSTSLLALYVVAQFFFDLGPNTTTFVVPGECFPTRYRATGHGISAAAGKIGAIVAQIISTPALTRAPPAGCTGTGCSPWLGGLLRLFALFMLCGTATSLLVPETRGLTLEELSGEPPTSYNAGRNGSIGGGGDGAASSSSRDRGRGRGRGRRLLSWWPALGSGRRWNPFLGGQPAGFAYPRAGGLKDAWRARRAGAVVMTGDGRPEMVGADAEMGQPSPARRKGWWRRRGYGNGTAKSDRDFVMTSTSSSSARAFSESVDMGHAGDVPGWNAGWGMIDRGAAPDNTIHLQDVGGLMR